MIDYVNTIWNKDSIKEFNSLLLSKSIPNKVDWTKNIINTNMRVLAIPTPLLRQICKDICSGNYEQFLEQNNFLYYENTIVQAILISKIKDFEKQKKYLLQLSKIVDNWATCDILKFTTKPNNANRYFELSLQLLSSPKIFERRIAIRILFSFVKMPEYTQKIFDVLESIKEEKEYYVNMCVAWLLQVMFLENREQTLNFLKQGKTNTFVKQKAISKCVDSYRISVEDKNILKKLRD